MYIEHLSLQPPTELSDRILMLVAELYLKTNKKEKEYVILFISFFFFVFGTYL